MINRSKQLTRRDALRAAAGAGAMVAGLPSRSVVASDLNSKYIDAHSHIWTRDIQRYPLREGVTLDDLDPPSFTAEELLSKGSTTCASRETLVPPAPGTEEATAVAVATAARAVPPARGSTSSSVVSFMGHSRAQ